MEKNSIYRTDKSNPKNDIWYFLWGLIFPIIGGIYFGFTYTKKEENATAGWYGVAFQFLIKFLTIFIYIFVKNPYLFPKLFFKH